jgi:hypothetical protein
MKWPICPPLPMMVSLFMLNPVLISIPFLQFTLTTVLMPVLRLVPMLVPMLVFMVFFE